MMMIFYRPVNGVAYPGDGQTMQGAKLQDGQFCHVEVFGKVN
jgi:hypothetical protein